MMKPQNSLNHWLCFPVFASCLCLCPAPVAAQTADDHVNQGRAYLAARDVMNANVEFATAVSMAPNHATGNVFYAATRLLTLANQPAGAALLDRLGFAAAGRDIYAWTAVPPSDTNGIPYAPSNMSAAELTAFLRTNVLTEIIGANSNLARISDTNFLLGLSSNETTTIAVTLDYGDLLMLRAGLYFGQYAGYTLYSWNVNAQLAALRSLATNQNTTAQGFLAQYPNLFTYATTNDLAAARQAFSNAVMLYTNASGFIRQRPAGVTRLFNFDWEMLEDEDKFCTTLVELSASLNGPVTLTVDSNLTVSLKEPFTGANPPRAFFPMIAGNRIVAGTLPDPTFGGMLLGLPAYQFEELLGHDIPFVSRFDAPQRLAGGSLLLNLNALNNNVFAIQTSTNLSAWSDGGLGLAEEGTISFVDTTTSAWARRFYRALELPEALSVALNIIDVSSETPLSNAMVVLSFPYDPSITALTNYTDGSGRVVLISRLPPPSGQYQVTISFPGYSPIQYDGYYWSNRRVSSTAYVAPVGYHPPNDNFAQRSTLSGTNITATGYNVEATKEPDEPGHGGYSGAQSVWWTWTAPADGAVIIDTIGSSFDTVLGAYTGSPVSNLTPVVRDRNSGGNGTSKVEFFVTAGTPYQIAVDGYRSDDIGRVVLNVRTTTPRPPSFVREPHSLTVTAGGSAYFSARADGTSPLTYQWCKSGTVIQGATSSSCSINNVQSGHAASYTVIVTNYVGSVTSAPAVLTVVPKQVTLEEVYSFPDSFGASTLVQGRDGALYGTSSTGGSSGYGSVFRVTTNGVLTTLASFGNTNGAKPRGGVVQGSDGALYGTTESGGGLGYGTAFRVTTNGVLTSLVSFNYANGANPYAGLVLGSDGAFYGTTVYGGGSGQGTVFRVTTNGVLTSLASFTYYSNGANPHAGLVQGSDGAFYGTTEYGGSYNGTVFRITTNGALTTLVSFAYTNGSYPRAALVQGSDGAFYGTTAYGGSSYDGTVFRVTTNGVLTTLVSFASTNGYWPQAALVQGSDGAFYGTTTYGGSSYDGTVFRVTTNGVLTTLVNFDYDNGMYPRAGLVQANDGRLYGITDRGRSGGYGTVFSVTTLGALTTVLSLTNLEGNHPQAGVVRDSDGAIYGTMPNGGNNNLGMVFRAATNGFLTTLSSFADTNGADPRAGLVRGNDGAFYGTTSDGGSEYYGTVFRVTTNGVLTSLVSFAYTNGYYPQATLVQGNDGAFYGTTSEGGSEYYGTVFRVTSNGVLTSLASFNYYNGANPRAGLVQGSDGALYGTTYWGGDYEYGTVFRVTTNGVLTMLTSFASNNGAYPQAGLAKGDDGLFYGTTSEGGDHNLGTVFRVTTNGSLTTLVSFAETNGSNPTAALVQGSDGAFYGTTLYGGSSYNGTVFRVTTNGLLTTLVSFNSSTGEIPCAGLMQGSDGAFYGTVADGGSRGGGKVFRMILDPLILSRPASRTAVAGSNVTFTVSAQGTPPMNYQWQRNGTNLYDGSRVSGSTTATLTLYNVNTNDAASYSVVISSAAGSETSLPATLTVLARPQFGSIARLPDRNIQFLLNGVPNTTLRIEASVNLTSWVTLTNIVNPTGPIQFIDLNATNFSKRFYRASYTP